MDISSLQDAGLALAIVAGLGIVSKVVITCVALRGTKPEQRPAILKTLPAVFRAFWFGVPIGRGPRE